MAKLKFITACSGVKNPQRCIGGKKRSSRAIRIANRRVKNFGIGRKQALKFGWAKVHRRRHKRHHKK